jgi:hypothetical protein
MKEHYQHTSLWKKAFDPRGDEFDEPRSKLKTAYQEFRSRVEILLQQIHKELPSLTCHDITHVDSLWRVASEIAGPDFDLNPAEAFVLGGAFLLHDAAHCRAAFPGGIQELQGTTEWKDAAAHYNFTSDVLIEGKESFQIVLFDTLRRLHPQQAKKLPSMQWPCTENDEKMYLLPHDELRKAYGDVIGEIAQSHWQHPRELEQMANSELAAPVCLTPANWLVDKLKLAVLLRTADAARIDEKRAPRFLIYMTQPQGISKEHWQFQARLHQPICIQDRNELIISGSPFPESELSAWWLAYDAANLANKELMAADRLLMANRQQRMAARSVASIHSPEAFSKYVPTSGWSPVDTNIKITDVKKLVEHFGGAKLYGDDPSAALRELLQNAVDAVHACRSMGYLGPNEGEIEVALEKVANEYWLHVTDTGIGMSCYVLTDVLLDFGHSLWPSAEVSGEWRGLASSGFEAIGQFGIGFYSVFMLGEKVRVVTRRYERKKGEADQWLLSFDDGVNKRPTLHEPGESEKLRRPGTRVSILIAEEKLKALCGVEKIWRGDSSSISFAQACARLTPAIDMNLYVKTGDEQRQLIVQANDWLFISSIDLLRRISPGYLESTPASKNGFWSYLSNVYNDLGEIVGRCTVRPSSLFDPGYGIGVIKGLRAGIVSGIAGIIMTKQSDLARKEAIPEISLTAIQKWAEAQKELLINNGKLSAKNSALLAHFGTNHTALIVGQINREDISLETFIEIISDLEEIIVHDGTIDFDETEDGNITPNDFEEDFQVLENVLELPRSRYLPDWLDQINDSAISCNSWSLVSVIETAVEIAWGYAQWDEESVTVGYVNGDDIDRDCKIARRLKEEET